MKPTANLEGKSSNFFDAFNADPHNYRYLDTANCIEYVFSEFGEKDLPLEEKLKLIKEHGSPRRQPLNRSLETEKAKVEFHDPVWEFQLIHAVPPEDK